MLYKKCVLVLVALLQGSFVFAEYYPDGALDALAVGLRDVAVQKKRTPPPLPAKKPKVEPSPQKSEIPLVPQQPTSSVQPKPLESVDLLAQIQKGTQLKKPEPQKPDQLDKPLTLAELIKLRAKKVTGAGDDEGKKDQVNIPLSPPSTQTSKPFVAIPLEKLEDLIKEDENENLKTAWKNLPQEDKKVYFDNQDLFDAYPGANKKILDELKKRIKLKGMIKQPEFNVDKIAELMQSLEEDPDAYVGDGNTFLHYVTSNKQDPRVNVFKTLLEDPKYAAVWERIKRNLKGKSGRSEELFDVLSKDALDHKSALLYIQQYIQLLRTLSEKKPLQPLSEKTRDERIKAAAEEIQNKKIKEIAEAILKVLEGSDTLDDLFSFLKDPDMYKTKGERIQESLPKLYNRFDTQDTIQNKFLKVLQQANNKELRRVLVGKPYLVDVLLEKNKALAYLTADDADRKGYITKFIAAADNDNKVSKITSTPLEKQLKNDDFFEPSTTTQQTTLGSEDDDW